MKAFIDLFLDARSVSTPFVAVRTFDNRSTIAAIQKSLGDAAESTPLISWDAIHGLAGLNEVGTQAASKMATDAGVEVAATVELTLALGVLESAKEDVIVFIHNPHLFWENDKRIIQGIANLRDDFKARGNMLVMLFGAGDRLPVELQQDVYVLDEPLPTREQLAEIVTGTFAFAAQEKKFAACKTGATPEVVDKAVAAGVGLPQFPFEQAVAQTLDKVKGKLDIPTLWNRKKEIVSQNPGLTYHPGHETLADLYKVDSFRNFGIKLLTGKYSPTLIIRMDEIEKQFAGNATDSSGTKGNLMGEFLTWIVEKRVICSLLVGVQGSSKSFSIYCLGGEYEKPVINYSVPAMEHEHVGMSAKHQRTAHRTLDSISDGRIWLVATANSLRGLPPELISRFQSGGIFFFDLPTEEEANGILDLKIKQFKLDPKQEKPVMTNWTGRDIENCAMKADLLGVSLVEAAGYIVPLSTSHKEQLEELRTGASGRFLSASQPGIYHHTPLAEVKHAPKVTITEAGNRKMR
jgi:hypothetical protein